MDQLRVAVASVALLVPSVVFAFNAYISYRERGVIEPYISRASSRQGPRSSSRAGSLHSS